VAKYHAIAAIGQAVLGYLEEGCPRDVFPAARFVLFEASDFQDPAAHIKEGIALYLYRVAVNTALRNRPPRPAVPPDGRRFRPSLPLDLHYLVTTWADTPAKQQVLLGWCMRALEDLAILPIGLLNRYSPAPETFGPSETVEFVAEPLSVQEMYNIWDPMKPNVHLSAAYAARMVVIDSDLPLPSDGPPAQTREFAYAEGGL
jgi:hypothetical protein